MVGVRRFAGWILILALIAGCSRDEEFATDSPISRESGGQRLVGQVNLDRPVAGATVEFFRLDGTPIATSGPVVTDITGVFRANLAERSATFLSVASSVEGGVTEAYAAEVEGLNPTSEMVFINPLTNLVAAYHREHPELSLAESTRAVSAGLGLPPDHDPRYHLMQGSHRKGFDVPTYLRHARAATRARTDGAAWNTPFVTTVVRSLSSPSNDPPVVVPTNPIFESASGTYWSKEGVQLGVAVVSTALQLDGIPAGALIGWSVNLLLGGGGSNGEQAAFQALANEIFELGQEVEAVYANLSQEIDHAFFSAAALNLIEQLAPIKALQQTYSSYLSSGMTASQQQTLVSQLTNPAFTSLLPAIHDGQMGASGFGATGLLQAAGNLVHLRDRPFFSNLAHFQPLMSEFTYFAGQQTSAMNLIVEAYHGQVPPNPELARVTYDQYSRNLATQATALPQPLDSDDVVYVRSAGLLFYRYVHGRATQHEAEELASAFQVGHYTKWRVANSSDILALIDPKRQFSIDELKAAGFDFTATEADPTNRDHSHYFIAGNDNISFPLDKGTGPIFGVRREVAGPNGNPAQEPENKWDDYHYCWMLVADARDQDPSLLPALGQLTSLEVVSGPGDTVRAQGAFNVNHTDYAAPYIWNNQINDVGFKTGTQVVSGIELTSRVSWASSNPSILRVGNLPANNTGVRLPTTPSALNFGPGVLTWLAPGSTDVTATAHLPFADGLPTLTGSLSLTNNSVPPAELQAVLISPKNSIITAAPSVTSLYLVGFYSDGTSRNLTEATWTASQPQARVVSLAGETQLDLSARPSASSFTVSATVNGRSDTATFYVNIP